MTTDPLTQFELLLKEGKLEEAKAMLGSLASRKLSPEEEASAKVLQVRLSIKLQNAINRAYIDSLDDSIARLKELRGTGHSLDETVKLAETRVSLAK
ncbi:MAG: hypothetical protein Q7R64_00640 [bacterium]|nr:hypothetical protein [bacterium]